MRNGFDVIAPFYDLLARCIFGKSIWNSQLATLRFIPENAVILIIGGGTGWFLKELMAATKASKVVYIDSSEKMIALSKQKMTSLPGQFERIDFRLNTPACIHPSEYFNVIITHFFLDLFTDDQVHAIMQPLHKALHKNGLWLCADFQLLEECSGRWWKKWLMNVVYTFFRIGCNIKARHLPKIPEHFKAYSMSCIYEAHFFSQLIVTQVYKKNSVKTG